jgi:transposase
MVFGFFTDAIDNALSVVGDILEGETPSRRKVAKLIDAGLSVAAIATAFGVGEEVIMALLEREQ